LDKTFKEYISEKEISRRVEELAIKINSDFAGKEVVFLGILNGASCLQPTFLKG